MTNMTAGKRRSHSKVASLPTKLKKAINKQLLAGRTYDEITRYLDEMQSGISRASLARYGKDYLTQYEKLNFFREQTRIIMESAGSRQGLDMGEAASQLALSTVMEYVMEMDSLKDAKATEVIKALTVLERTAIQRERLKLETKKAAEEAKRQKRLDGTESEYEDDGLLQALQTSAKDVWKDV